MNSSKIIGIFYNLKKIYGILSLHVMFVQNNQEYPIREALKADHICYSIENKLLQL